MDATTPTELYALLESKDAASTERAWTDFLESYSPLLLKTARAYGGDYDAVMDRYRYVIEALRRDDFQRLRSYEIRRRSTFRGWLAVVSRRLCIDYERSRYGRGGRAAEEDTSRQRRLARRRLVDLVAADLDVALLPPTGSPDPEKDLRATELGRALEGAIAGLEPREQLLLKLRFEDELSVRQVADVMRYPTIFHVYRQLRAVLGKLRRELEGRGVRDPEP